MEQFKIRFKGTDITTIAIKERDTYFVLNGLGLCAPKTHFERIPWYAYMPTLWMQA